MVKWVGVEELLPFFFYVLEFFNKLGPMTEWEQPLHTTQIQILTVRKERNVCTTGCKKKTANNLICVGCSAHNVHNTVHSPSGCLPVDTHPPTGKKLQVLLHLCHTCWSFKVCEITWTEYKSPYSYHPSFPPQSDKKFFMCHSGYGEAEHKCTWREMWNKLLLKLEHRHSKAFFFICCERSARSVRGKGSNDPNFEGHHHNFCKSFVEYIQELCVPFLAPLQSVVCVGLEKVRDWVYVQQYHCLIQTVITKFVVKGI